MPTRNTAASHEITFGEEEIADVSLATFYVFDKENVEHPSPAYDLLIGDTDTGTEAAEAAAAEVALGFGGEVAAAAAVEVAAAAAVEAAGGGAINIVR
jgi:hypothetical protein